jgi:hypothetical protein
LKKKNKIDHSVGQQESEGLVLFHHYYRTSDDKNKINKEEGDHQQGPPRKKHPKNQTAQLIIH